jgi:hypothetical protein
MAPIALSAILLLLFVIVCMAITLVQTIINDSAAIVGVLLFVLCMSAVVAVYIIAWKSSKKK